MFPFFFFYFSALVCVRADTQSRGAELEGKEGLFKCWREETCLLHIYKNTEQTSSCIDSIQDSTFTGQIKDDSVFYRMGDNPCYETCPM